MNNNTYNCYLLQQTSTVLFLPLLLSIKCENYFTKTRFANLAAE